MGKRAPDFKCMAILKIAAPLAEGLGIRLRATFSGHKHGHTDLEEFRHTARQGRADLAFTGKNRRQIALRQDLRISYVRFLQFKKKLPS